MYITKFYKKKKKNYINKTFGFEKLHEKDKSFKKFNLINIIE